RIIAAQSIGEPGTQLTMRTFHTRGAAGADITHGLPRIQDLFGARNLKHQPAISNIDEDSTELKRARKRKVIVVKNEEEEDEHPISYNARQIYEIGDEVAAGDELTEGSIDPKELLEVKGVETVQNYLLREVQRVYRMQGVEIGDKHVEVMV